MKELDWTKWRRRLADDFLCRVFDGDSEAVEKWMISTCELIDRVRDETIARFGRDVVQVLRPEPRPLDLEPGQN